MLFEDIWTIRWLLLSIDARQGQASGLSETCRLWEMCEVLLGTFIFCFLQRRSCHLGTKKALSHSHVTVWVHQHNQRVLRAAARTLRTRWRWRLVAAWRRSSSLARTMLPLARLATSCRRVK